MARLAQKALRVGLLRGGRIIDERRLAGEEVSAGSAAGNTFLLSAPGLGDSTVLFRHEEGRWLLRFNGQLQGRLFIGGRELELNLAREHGLAHRDGEGYALPLDEEARGRLDFGALTLFFQLVTPLPAPPPLALFRRGPWQTADRRFLGLLAGAISLALALSIALWLTPPPPEDEVQLDQLPDRFAQLLMPVPLPPKKVEAPAAVAEKSKETHKAESPKPEAGASKAQLAKVVSNKGLLRVLGARGGGSGALADLLGSGTGSAEVASALAGAQGIGVATIDPSGAAPKGGQAGSVASIGRVGTRGGGHVSLGEKGDVRVAGLVTQARPDVDSPDVDPEKLARFVRLKLGAIQACYERALKRDPTLRGKVAVRFSITPSGRADAIGFDADTLGNAEVADCIRSLIAQWIFPFRPSESVPVAYPFVFAPAS